MKTQILKIWLVMLMVLFGMVSVADAGLISLSELTTQYLTLAQMRPPNMPIHIELLISAICVPLMAFILAFFLKIATKWVVKFEIPYWDAYKISVIYGVINVLTSLLPRWIGGIGFSCFIAVVQFFIGAVLYGTMINYPDSKEPIGLGKGLLISLCVIAIVFIIALLIFGTIFLCLIILRSGMR